MNKKITMVWDDTVAQSVTNTFNLGVQTGESLDTYMPGSVDVFLNSLAFITNAGLKKVSISMSSDRGADDVGTKYPMDSEEFNTVDQKLVYSYMEKVADNDWKDKTIEIPAPKSSLFELIVGQGKRLKKEHADNLAVALESFTGNVCTAKEGWLKGDK